MLGLFGCRIFLHAQYFISTSVLLLYAFSDGLWVTAIEQKLATLLLHGCIPSIDVIHAHLAKIFIVFRPVLLQLHLPVLLLVAAPLFMWHCLLASYFSLFEQMTDLDFAMAHFSDRAVAAIDAQFTVHFIVMISQKVCGLFPALGLSCADHPSSFGKGEGKLLVGWLKQQRLVKVILGRVEVVGDDQSHIGG